MKANRFAVIIAALLLSLPDKNTLSVSMVLLSVYLCWAEGSRGAVIALLIISLRGNLNGELGISMSKISMLKWVLLFGLSLYGIFAKQKTGNSSNRFYLIVALYCIYLISCAFLVGSYPVISSFKVLSWAVIFCAVFYIIHDDPSEDWITILRFSLSAAVILSLFTIPFPSIGYQLNNRGLQGIFSHPNIFGILCAFCFSLHLLDNRGPIGIGRLFIILSCAVCAFLSLSRTAIFSIVIVCAASIFIGDMSMADKIVLFLGLAVVSGLVLTVYMINNPETDNYLTKVIFKGHTENILYSREVQAQDMLELFKASPVIGTGFMAPYNPSIRSFEISFNKIVEPGNIIFGLLGFTGGIGIAFFFGVYSYLFKRTTMKYRVAFFVPILLSMGEMAFFSSNNIAILYYILYGAIYMAEPQSDKEKPRGALRTT